MSKYSQPAAPAPKRYGYRVAVAAPAGYGLAVKQLEQDQVAVVTGTADKAFGILQNVTIENNECAEVAHPGGGAFAKIGGTVAYGDELSAAADGRLVKAPAGARVIAVAFSDGVANDIIPVEVVASRAAAV